MRRAGNWSRKLPARTYSTSWHSAGEALSTDTARGGLLAAATGMIFVPLPRLVGPTAKPRFSAREGGHPRTRLPDSAFLARVGSEPDVSAPLPVCRSAPIAGIGGGRSDTADTSPASRAILPRCPEHTVENRTGIVPRPATIIRPPRWPQPRLLNGPRFVVQFPASGQVTSRLSQSNNRIARNRAAAIYETGSSFHPNGSSP
jgi:hypothetical protein